MPTHFHIKHGIIKIKTNFYRIGGVDSVGHYSTTLPHLHPNNIS